MARSPATPWEPAPACPFTRTINDFVDKPYLGPEHGVSLVMLWLPAKAELPATYIPWPFRKAPASGDSPIRDVIYFAPKPGGVIACIDCGEPCDDQRISFGIFPLDESSKKKGSNKIVSPEANVQEISSASASSPSEVYMDQQCRSYLWRGSF